MSWDGEFFGRVRSGAGFSSLGPSNHPVATALYSFSSFVCIGYNIQPSRRFSFYSVSIMLASLLLSRRISMPPSYHPHISFPQVGKLHNLHQDPPATFPVFSYGDCSPIAKKTCPSQLILNPSAVDSAFSTAGSTLGILHGISGILIYIWQSA